MLIYEQLKSACLPFIQNYKEDLTVHDRKAITEWDGVPFLHFTRAYGTQLILMPPSDHPCWPKDGEVVPYIFGKANRLHILQEKFTMVKYPYERLRCIHHARSFLPGQPLELQEIPLKFAVEAMERYINWTLRDWREKARKADPVHAWALAGRTA